MKTTLIFVAAFCMLAALPVRANLVVNGGFETGAKPPWYENIIPGLVNGFDIVDTNVKNGNYAANLGPSGAMFQTVPTATDQEYILDFWAKAGNTSGVLYARIGDNIINTGSRSISPGDYSEYAISLTASSGPLSLFWGSGGSVYIDDVSLTPVPEPTTMIAGALLLLPFGMSTIRILRKNRAA